MVLSSYWPYFRKLASPLGLQYYSLLEIELRRIMKLMVRKPLGKSNATVLLAMVCPFLRLSLVPLPVTKHSA